MYIGEFIMVDKNSIDIWAIPIHVNENKKQIDAFNFCLDKGIIGIGWETSKTIGGKNIDYENIFNDYSNFIGSPKLSSFEKYVKGYNQINKDDLIWTRSGNEYYLCRFTGERVDYYRNNMTDDEIKEHEKYDIWHGLKCEFIRVGTQESVTGTIVNIFCAGGIRHFASNVEKTKEFSMRLYNKLTNVKYYDIDEEALIDIDNMKSEELEELVTTYLQVEKNLGVYTSTCKTNTKTYECVMFDKSNFIKSYVQVKAGEINLDDDEYMNIYNNNIFYFYSNSERYSGSAKNDNIKIISKSELIRFLKKIKK